MKRLGVICITLLLVCSLVMVTVESAGDALYGAISEAEFKSGRPFCSEGHDIIDIRLRETIALKPVDEYVEVMIRISPKEFDEITTNAIHWSNVIDDLKEHSEREQSGIIGVVEEGQGRILNTFWIANAMLAEVRVETLNELATQKNVWRIHENFEVSIHGTPSTEARDISYTRTVDLHNDRQMTWGLERLDVADVWDMGIDGTGIRVAVSDTGVDMNHPDLMGKMVNVDGDEYYTGGWIHFDASGKIIPDSTPHDDSGHGTHCSGTILGGSHSGKHIGVAPGAELMHALVLPRGDGTASQVFAGMQWKAEPFDRHGNILEPVEAHRAHVASMSWGSSGYHAYLEEPIQNLKNSGVVPVASIGNSGHGAYSSPGAIYETFGIGASNVNDDIAGFSSGAIVEDGRGDTPEQYVKPDFSAPGVDVFSSVPGGEWDYYDGTSMAAPHVAGTVALMLDSYTSVYDIYEALAETADYYVAGDDLGATKNTRYGHGIINAQRAVEAVSTIRVLKPSDINRTHATLRARVFDLPFNEAEVYLKYRETGVHDWKYTDPVTVSTPQPIEARVGGLVKGTAYECKAVLEWDEQQKTTFPIFFETHKDVEVVTTYPEHIAYDGTLLRGEVTHIYVEEAEISFKYKRDGHESWEKVVIGNITMPMKFSYELDDFDPYIYYRYKAVAGTDIDEFTGELQKFLVSSPEPEWCDDEESYLICDLAELQWMKNDLESKYTLTKDIDATESKWFFGGKGFEPVGTYRFLDDSVSFHGSFEGNGHTISNMFINRGFTNYVGLFGFISFHGNVRNISLTDVNIRGYDFVGALSGHNEGDVSNIFIMGRVNGQYYVGGLVGRNHGIIQYSSVISNVGGDNYVGGLVGYNAVGTVVSHSYAKGSITGRWYVGGIIGENTATVSDSYASASVDGHSSVGGLIGLNSWGTITNSFSLGTVNGNDRVGGLIGFKRGGSMESSFWDIESSGLDKSDGGLGKITSEMMDITTFIGAGWDISMVAESDDRNPDYVWNIVDHETYPFLSCEGHTYTLEVNKIGDGKVEYHPYSHIYPHGTVVTMTATPSDGWRFSHWTGDVPAGEEETDSITLVIDHDKSLTAHFDVIFHNLSLSLIGEGEVAPSACDHTYPYGTLVNISATPSSGWRFSHWTGDVQAGEEENENITIVIDDDRSLIAHFDVIFHDLSLSLIGEGEVAPSVGDYAYPYGTLVNISAAPSPGWRFSHWSGDVPAGEEENENITIAMTREINITANFEEMEFLPNDFVLNVTPTEGEAPLEVNITISAYNTGLLEGSIDVMIDGVVVYTLVIPANENTQVYFTYEFNSSGTFDVVFGALSEMVIVQEAEEDGKTLPWVLLIIVLLVLLIAMFLLIKSKPVYEIELTSEDDEKQVMEDDIESFTMEEKRFTKVGEKT